MKISVAGTGYVGLVTGVCLSEIGHNVLCFDIDEAKVEKMKAGISPIYEPGLDELMKQNIERGRLHFTTSVEEAYADADIIYIAVGTPENKDGSANLTYIDRVAEAIGKTIRKNVIVVTKSTVPVGTNDRIKNIVESNKVANVKVDIVSNPEFLREGSAIHDTFNGDRIVIGAESEQAAAVIEELNRPYGIPIMKTDIHSAEMIKYASNAFLATKISFINEISNICEKLGANIDDVATGIGLDKRIGSQFLQAGIGYGGSCFPKDTKALVQIAGDVEHKFELLESVIKVNNNQQALLVAKAKEIVGSLQGKRAAILGLAFKPNTDDVREAASLVIAKKLTEEGASVIGYDPIAVSNTKHILGDEIEYTESIQDALNGADIVFIVTEWKEVKEISFSIFKELMKTPVILDGRNCYSVEEAEQQGVTYVSMGRPSVITQ
ncbi:UDP-glucose dehydrogenase family protein [Bacillus salitolerans]|uniref:UDP-glucose 6-dehydrogenase n=1 Tax=Bacillus salitolerans TaxID=1437434 RepID=A0ABW4LQ20_9BACI